MILIYFSGPLLGLMLLTDDAINSIGQSIEFLDSKRPFYGRVTKLNRLSLQSELFEVQVKAKLRTLMKIFDLVLQSKPI